jgi:hypothetical protein
MKPFYSRHLLMGIALLISISTGLSLVARISSAQDGTEKDGRYYESAANKAYREKDLASFLENMQKAAQLRPNHPRLTYNLAVAYALNGQRDAALASLRQVAEMGMIVPAERDADFDSIKQTPEFIAIVARIKANKLPEIRSTQAFTLREKGFVPEGLAYDSLTDTFYLGSIYKRKIVAITSGGEVRDFATERDGLWSVFGMRVDAARRILWVCTAAHPQMSNYQAAENGISGIYKFDLRTGKLVAKYLLPNTPKLHLLGDLVLDAKGNVFASDSVSPAIYVIRPEQDKLELFMETSAFASPQGLAFTADGKSLFMADYSNGILRIDLATKNVTNLAPPRNATLLGIDGLYEYQGSLIGVQNGVNPWRLVRLTLSRDAGSIARVETIEANNPVFDEPTLGVLVKEDFFFIANSQWGAIDDQGKLAAADKLKDPVVLRIKLAP